MKANHRIHITPDERRETPCLRARETLTRSRVRHRIAPFGRPPDGRHLRIAWMVPLSRGIFTQMALEDGLWPAPE